MRFPWEAFAVARKQHCAAAARVKPVYWRLASAVPARASRVCPRRTLSTEFPVKKKGWSTQDMKKSGASDAAAYEAKTTAEGTADDDYWLTLVAYVEHTGSGPQTTSFNAAVDSAPIPEPASIAIWTLMAGIGGLIWMRRRSK